MSEGRTQIDANQPGESMTLVPRLQRTLWLLLVILPLGIPAVGQEETSGHDDAGV
jgi:hypothetical protein